MMSETSVTSNPFKELSAGFCSPSGFAAPYQSPGWCCRWPGTAPSDQLWQCWGLAGCLAERGVWCVLELSPQQHSSPLGEEPSTAHAGRWDRLSGVLPARKLESLGDGDMWVAGAVGTAQVLCVLSRCWLSRPCAAVPLQSCSLRSQQPFLSIHNSCMCLAMGQELPNSPTSSCSQPELLTPAVSLPLKNTCSIPPSGTINN